MRLPAIRHLPRTALSLLIICSSLGVADASKPNYVTPREFRKAERRILAPIGYKTLPGGRRAAVLRKGALRELRREKLRLLGLDEKDVNAEVREHVTYLQLGNPLRELGHGNRWFRWLRGSGIEGLHQALASELIAVAGDKSIATLHSARNPGALVLRGMVSQRLAERGYRFTAEQVDAVLGKWIGHGFHFGNINEFVKGGRWTPSSDAAEALAGGSLAQPGRVQARYSRGRSEGDEVDGKPVGQLGPDVRGETLFIEPDAFLLDANDSRENDGGQPITGTLNPEQFVAEAREFTEFAKLFTGGKSLFGKGIALTGYFFRVAHNNGFLRWRRPTTMLGYVTESARFLGGIKNGLGYASSIFYRAAVGTLPVHRPERMAYWGSAVEIAKARPDGETAAEKEGVLVATLKTVSQDAPWHGIEFEPIRVATRLAVAVPAVFARIVGGRQFQTDRTIADAAASAHTRNVYGTYYLDADQTPLMHNGNKRWRPGLWRTLGGLLGLYSDNVRSLKLGAYDRPQQEVADPAHKTGDRLRHLSAGPQEFDDRVDVPMEGVGDFQQARKDAYRDSADFRNARSPFPHVRKREAAAAAGGGTTAE